MYVYVCACICRWVYPTTCTFTNVYLYTQAPMHLCIQAFFTYKRIYAYTHVCMHMRQHICTKTHIQEYTCTHIRGFKYSRLPRFPVRFGPNHRSPACVRPKDDIRNPDVPIYFNPELLSGWRAHIYIHAHIQCTHARIHTSICAWQNIYARTHVEGQQLVASLKSFLQNSLIFQGSFAKVAWRF